MTKYFTSATTRLHNQTFWLGTSNTGVCETQRKWLGWHSLWSIVIDKIVNIHLLYILSSMGPIEVLAVVVISFVGRCALELCKQLIQAPYREIRAPYRHCTMPQLAQATLKMMRTHTQTRVMPAHYTVHVWSMGFHWPNNNCEALSSIWYLQADDTTKMATDRD